MIKNQVSLVEPNLQSNPLSSSLSPKLNSVDVDGKSRSCLPIEVVEEHALSGLDWNSL